MRDGKLIVFIENRTGEINNVIFDINCQFLEQTKFEKRIWTMQKRNAEFKF